MLAARMQMAAAGPGDGSFIGSINRLGLGTNLKLCLDAGDANSYSGSGQKWLDVAGGGYDFMLGSETGSPSTGDEPTFNGTAGDLSSAEYWSFDGGDFFRYDTTNEAWMDNIHQDNALFTIAFWVFSPDPVTGDGVAGTIAGSAVNTGFEMVTVSGAPGFRVTTGGSDVLANKQADSAMTAGAWNFVAISIDEATGAGGGFHYLNGAYNQVSSSDTFDATYTGPSAGSATYTLELGAAGNNNNVLGSGHRFGGVFIWEGQALSKAQLDNVFAQTNRYGI